MTETKKHGGKRSGAGRPKAKPPSHSDRVKKNYQKAAVKIAKETGMTVEEHFLRLALDPDRKGRKCHTKSKRKNGPTSGNT
jgi:hypothetical protein